MKEILSKLDFDREEIERIIPSFDNISLYQLESFIDLLMLYRVNKDYIKEILLKRKDLLNMDIDQLKYILDAILANHDIIEETLLEIV